MLKEKIKSRLKEKFPGVNLSAKRLDAIADKLAAKITEESEIDGKLDEANGLMDFAAIAKEDDRVRQLEAKAKAPKPNDPPEKKEDPQPGDDTPSWAKALIEQNNKLAGEVASLKAGTTAKTRETLAMEKFKGLNEDFVSSTMSDLSLLNFDSDETFNSWVERKVTEGTKLTQGVASQQLAGQGQPALSSTVNLTDATAKAVIGQWASQNTNQQKS